MSALGFVKPVHVLNNGNDGETIFSDIDDIIKETLGSIKISRTFIMEIH